MPHGQPRPRFAAELWRRLLPALLLAGCGATQERAAPPAFSAPAVGPDELVARGDRAAARGDALRAEQYFALAVAEGADRDRVLPRLLESCLSSLRLRAALNYAEPELRRRPDDVELRLLVATIHLSLRQAGAAYRELALLTERAPHVTEAQYLLGVISEELLDDPDQAKSRFRAYLAAAPEGPRAPEVRGRLASLSVSAHTLPFEREVPQ